MRGESVLSLWEDKDSGTPALVVFRSISGSYVEKNCYFGCIGFGG
jgi:hypothetical protein